MADPSEGSGYGCWFSQAVGTGVFVSVGETLTFEDREFAEADLGRWCGPQGRRNCTHDSRMEVQAWNTRIDAPWTVELQHRGYDSCQIRRKHRHQRAPFLFKEMEAEMFVVAPSCMTPHVRVTGSCPPLDLRSGWDHARPCSCRELPSMSGVPKTRPLMTCVHTVQVK